MSQLLVLDNAMDRAELRTLLDRLPPVERVAFVRWCCGQVRPTERGHLPAPVPGGYAEVVRAAYRCDEASARLTRMCYADLCVLLWQYQLDATRAAVELERRARRRR